MTPNPNLNFLIDIALFVGVAFLDLRILFFRSKYKKADKKPKTGTIDYAIYESVYGWRMPSIAAVITLLVLVKTPFDVRSILRAYNRSGLHHIGVIFVLGSLFSVFIAGVVYFLLTNDSKQREKQ